MLETMSRSTERPPPKERRRGLWILLILFVLLGGFVASAGGWWAWAIGSCGEATACQHEKLVIAIPTGATGSEVAEILKANEIIRSTFAFNLMARFRAKGGFEAGTYTALTTNMTVSEALDVLKEGPLPKQALDILIREGLNVRQTAEVVQDSLGVRIRDFVEAATSGEFSLPPYLPEGSSSTEGFLFPNTYELLAGIDADETVAKLLEEFQRQVAELPWNKYKRFGLENEYQVVIVASMVEREAKFDEDRGKIARVIYNRLKEGMLLQIDATVQYALDKYGPLTLEDLEAESPYNTYLHEGLPPTPIASPGLASLAAALSPTKGDWLYYVVTDAEGHHEFTASYEEFLRLKDKYQG